MNLPKPPKQSYGLHDYILEQTRQLVLAGLSQQDIEALLIRRCIDCGRPAHILAKEISDATCGALEWQGKAFDGPGGVRIAGPTGKGLKWHPVNVQRQQAVLLEMDEWCFDTLTGHSRNNVSKFCYEDLFCCTNYNICCATKIDRPIIRPLSKWLEWTDAMEQQQFIVPNPMLSCDGRKEINNTSKRLYFVVEFDMKEIIEKEGLDACKDRQAKLILWLAVNKWPLAMVVWSGSKSLHAWFPCYSKTKRQIQNFVLTATELGADRAMRIPCQYCRMPNGFNYKTGARQEVVYYDQDIIWQHNKFVRRHNGSQKEGESIS